LGVESDIASQISSELGYRNNKDLIH